MAAAGEPMAVPPLRWPSDAELRMPGSKSEANRLLVAAAARGVPTFVHAVTASDDVRHLVAGLRALGYAARFDERGALVEVGPRSAPFPARGELFCGNAGTALRFLVSLAAITPGEWTLTGDAALQRRPTAQLVTAWRQLGVDATDNNGCPPVRVRSAGAPRGGTVQLDASTSSQFVSSLLLVGAALRSGLDVQFSGEAASAGYVGWTCEMLTRLGARATLRADGARATLRADGARVEPGFARDAATELVCEGDWSSMGTWTCLGHLTGSRVRAANLPAASAQPDERLADVLRALPARGDTAIDVGAMPDQFMNLAIVAAHRNGTTRLTGARNLRVKESDRVAVMARELTKLGADVDELPDGLVVRGGRALRGGVVDPQDDHRIAMAFALAGMLSPGMRIASPQCVTKSYPGFWTDLATVARERRCVAVVGMRGAGKSTFARAFAAQTYSRCVDTDEQFVAAHGPIDAFVAAHGWPAFRALEEKLMMAALRSHIVVATGGGAIESERTRELLRAVGAVWLDADAALLRARLAADAAARPSVTGRPVLDEIDELLARRRPLYEQVAHVRIDATLPVHEQVEVALRALGAPCRWPGSDAGDATR
jgi:5-enolpyruvylshikimate-3-phosphate synthase/shikimate kinase